MAAFTVLRCDADLLCKADDLTAEHHETALSAAHSSEQRHVYPIGLETVPSFFDSLPGSPRRVAFIRRPRELVSRFSMDVLGLTAEASTIAPCSREASVGRGLNWAPFFVQLSTLQFGSSDQAATSAESGRRI